MSNRDVVFALYPDVTQLDFAGPLEFLSRLPDTRCLLCPVEGGTLTASGAITFANVARLSDVDSCGLQCVPGGYGCVAAMEDELYLSSVRRLARSARYVSAVCTGSLLLGAAGLLQGKRAASHWAWRDLLAAFGAVPDDGRVVRDGNVFTSGGVTAGIDLALTLLAEISGTKFAQAVQLALEYAPAPPFNSGRPETAPPDILQATIARLMALPDNGMQR